MSDKQPTLGNVLRSYDYPQRDAVHVAIAPVVASQPLRPGEHVGFVKAGDYESVGICGSPVGIIDPFLKRDVATGELCWLFLYPNTVTGMRHEWAHRAFDGLAHDKAASMAWLTAFAAKCGMTYERLTDSLCEWIDYGDYVLTADRSEYGRDELYPECGHELWEHYERATGIAVPENRKGNFFTCSC